MRSDSGRKNRPNIYEFIDLFVDIIRQFLVSVPDQKVTDEWLDLFLQLQLFVSFIAFG